VAVTPCPVYLGHLRTGPGSVTVTVTGPGVVSSTILSNNCTYGNHYRCHVYQEDPVTYLVSSGDICSAGFIKFDAYQASGTLIGWAQLRVHNHYCPG